MRPLKALHLTAPRLAAPALVIALLFAAFACSPGPAALAEREMQRLLGDDARAVKVRIDGTKATLAGSVQNRSTRVISEQIALARPGIESVDNQLAVPERQPLERMYMDSVDNGLLFRVEFFLLRRVGPAAIKDLEARAVEGIVSLRGPVSSESVRKAIVETTTEVEDVRKVIDLMRVAAPNEEKPADKPAAPM
jgi:hypothetical protein